MCCKHWPAEVPTEDLAVDRSIQGLEVHCMGGRTAEVQKMTGVERILRAEPVAGDSRDSTIPETFLFIKAAQYV